jgi:hypothetical protein
MTKEIPQENPNLTEMRRRRRMKNLRRITSINPMIHLLKINQMRDILVAMEFILNQNK